MTLSEYGNEKQNDTILDTPEKSNKQISLIENKKIIPDQLYTILQVNPSAKFILKRNVIELKALGTSYFPLQEEGSTLSSIVENNPTFREFISLLLYYNEPLTNGDIEEIIKSNIRIQLDSDQEATLVPLVHIFTIIAQQDIGDIPGLSIILTQQNLEDIRAFIGYYGWVIQHYLNHSFYTKGASNALVGYENIWKLLKHVYQELDLFIIENGKWTVKSNNITLAIISYIEYQHKLILVAASENNIEELGKLFSNIKQIEHLDMQKHLVIPSEMKAKMYYAKLLCELKLKTVSPESMTHYISVLTEPNYYDSIDYITKTDLALAILEYIQNNTITPELQDLCINFVIGPKIRLYQPLPLNQLENTILQSLEHFAVATKNDFALFQINLYKIRTTNHRETVKNLSMKCFEILETSFDKNLETDSDIKEPLFLDSFLSRGLRKTLRDDDDKNRNIILRKHRMDDYTQYQSNKHLIEEHTSLKPDTKKITIDYNESAIDMTSLDYSLELIDKTFSCRFVILGPKGTAILSHHFDGAGSIDLSPLIEETKQYAETNALGEFREKVPTNTAINSQYSSDLYIRRFLDYTVMFNLNKNSSKRISADTWRTSIDPLLEVIRNSLTEGMETQPEEKEHFLSAHHRNFMNTIEGSYINYFLQYDFSKRNIQEFSGEKDNIINQDLYTTRKDFTDLKEGNNFAFGMNSIRELIKEDPSYVSSTHSLAESYVKANPTLEKEQQDIYNSVLSFTKLYDQITTYLRSKTSKDAVIEILRQQFPTGISTKGLKKFKTIFSCLHEASYQKQNGKGLLFRKLDFSNADVSLAPIIQETIDIVSLFEYYQVLCHAFKADLDPGKKALEVIIIWANKKYLNPELVSTFHKFIEQQNKHTFIEQDPVPPLQTNNMQSDGNILVNSLYSKFVDEIENIVKLLRKYEIMEVSTKTIIKGYMPEVLREIHKNLGFSCTITISRHGPTPSDLVVLPSLSVEQKKSEGLIDPHSQIAEELFEALQLKYDKQYETDKEKLLSSILKEKYGIHGKNTRHFFANMLSKTGFGGTDVDAIHSATSARCKDSGSILKELIRSKAPIQTLHILNNPDKHTGIRALGNSIIKDIADGTQKEMLLKYLYTYIINPQDTSNIIICHGSPGIHLVNIIHSLQTEYNKESLHGFDIDIGKTYVFNFVGGKLRPIKKVPGQNIFIDEDEGKTHLFSLTNKKRFYRKLAPKLSRALKTFNNGILVKYLKEKNIADDFLSNKLVKLYEQEDLFRDFLYNLKNDNPETYIAFYEYLEYYLDGADIKNYLDYFTISTDELLKESDSS